MDNALWDLSSAIANIVLTGCLFVFFAGLATIGHGWRRLIGIVALVAYGTVGVMHNLQFNDFQEWRTEPVPFRKYDLPRSVHSTLPCPGGCPNTSLLAGFDLLVAGDLDFVERGTAQVVRWQLYVNDERCWDRTRRVVVRSEDPYYISHAICALSEPVDAPEAEMRLSQEIAPVSDSVPHLVRRYSLTDASTGREIDHVYRGYIRYRYQPPVLDLFWRRGPGPDGRFFWASDRAPTLYQKPAGGTDWKQHEMTRLLDWQPAPREDVYVRYGISSDWLMKALVHENAARAAILFACKNAIRVEPRVFEEIDLIARTPARPQHQLARELREGWCKTAG